MPWHNNRYIDTRDLSPLLEASIAQAKRRKLRVVEDGEPDTERTPVLVGEVVDELMSKLEPSK